MSLFCLFLFNVFLKKLNKIIYVKYSTKNNQYLNMKKLKNISLLLFAVFALYSCTEEDTETPKENPQTYI